MSSCSLEQSNCCCMLVIVIILLRPMAFSSLSYFIFSIWHSDTCFFLKILILIAIHLNVSPIYSVYSFFSSVFWNSSTSVPQYWSLTICPWLFCWSLWVLMTLVNYHFVTKIYKIYSMTTTYAPEFLFNSLISIGLTTLNPPSWML